LCALLFSVIIHVKSSMPRGRIIARKTIPGWYPSTKDEIPRPASDSTLIRQFRENLPRQRPNLCAWFRKSGRVPKPAQSLMNTDCSLHAAVDGQLRAKTARDRRTPLARYVRPDPGHVKLSLLKPLDLQCLLILTKWGLRRARFAIPTRFCAAPSIRQRARRCRSRIPPQICRCAAPTNASSVSLSQEKRSPLLILPAGQNTPNTIMKTGDHEVCGSKRVDSNPTTPSRTQKRTRHGVGKV
jgi:hypothetical protein